MFYAVGRVSILIATDVASRGLDVKDIRYVYLYFYNMIYMPMHNSMNWRTHYMSPSPALCLC